MIDIVPLQNNFKEFRDFVLDDFIRKQLDNTINYLVDYLELPYAYIFLSQEDMTFFTVSGDFEPSLLPSTFSEFTNQIITNNNSFIKSNLKEKLNLVHSSTEIQFFSGFPITIHEKEVVGTICFLDIKNKEFSDKDLKTIKFSIDNLQSFLKLHLENFNFEKAITKSKERFDLFIENSKEIFYELQLDGTILYVSESWTESIGHPIDEIIGKNTANIIHPDDLQSVYEFLSKLTVNQKCAEAVVYRLLHKKGYYVWHSSDVKLIERDNQFYYIGNCRDITNFIKAQEEISYQKEFYEKILDRLPIDLGVWDINHKYLYLNQAAIRNNELRKFIIGKDDFDYAKHTKRDDTFAKLRRERFVKALDTREIVEWEDQIIGLQGELFFHTRKFIPIYNDDGSFDMMTGYGIDLTESKRINEEILRSRQLINSVIQNAAVGIIVQGPQSEFLEYNRAACEMLGLTEDQMLGKSSFDPHWKVVHLDGTEFKPEEHPVPQAIKKEIPVNNIIMGVHRPITNDLVWLLVDAIPVLGESKELLYVICTFNDITARKKAEDALKISNERFTYASEATSDALWDWDIINNEIFVGESYSYLFGYQFKDNIIPAEICESFVHPLDKERYDASIDKALEEGHIKWSHEYRYLKANGNYAYVSDKAIIIRDDKGNPVRMIGAMQNKTKEKKLNDKLLQSEERFKGAFFHSSLGMAIVDLEGYWIEVNDRLCQILGYTKEEFKKLTFSEITYFEDLAEDLDNKAKLVKGEQPGFSMEKRYVHKNKSLIWVLLSVSLVRNAQGKIQHYVAQIIDISERKKMEEENRILIEENNRNKAIQLNEVKNMYRLLADNIIDLVCLHSLDTTFQYVSPSVKTLLGYSPQELIGTLPEQLVHPDDLEKFKKQSKKILSRTGGFSEQLRLRNASGEYSWFETNATLVFENGIPVSFQSSTRDITQRKKAEKIIEDTLVQERQLNELRTNLVSTISHEFRTPMTTIRTSAELITMYLEGSEFNFNPQVEKRVQTITEEIDRIVELMDAVLTISKDDAGKTNFSPVYCNLKEICLDVIETSYGHLKDSRGVDATYEDEAIIFADVNLIKYTLFNVLSNAFKYSEGSQNVKLHLFIKEQNVIIEVIDFGIGIPQEDQSKLFNTFYRASNSNGIQGTGLGLYIIKMFTKKNSGKVKLESQLGKGTKVTLKFPLVTLQQ